MSDVLIKTSIESSHYALKHVAMNFAKSSLKSPHLLRRNYLGTVNIKPRVSVLSEGSAPKTRNILSLWRYRRASVKKQIVLSNVC